MAGATPTARSLERLRRLGYPAQVVEKWVNVESPAYPLARAAEALLQALSEEQRLSLGLFAASLQSQIGRLYPKGIPAPKSGPPGRRIDLFGCIDVLALDGKPGVLGIQACAASGLSSRVAKAREIPELRAWLLAGNRWQCWGWREVWLDTSARTKAKRWQPRVVELYLEGDQMLERVAELPVREAA